MTRRPPNALLSLETDPQRENEDQMDPKQLELFETEDRREQRQQDEAANYIACHESFADMDDYYNDEEGH